jgi:DNA helicase II / ATP-dependent DNA helicase PcrA
MLTLTKSCLALTQIINKTAKIFGPPGTGKTTRLIKIIEKWLRLGVQPHEIVYVSFTNKAVNEAVSRVIKKFTNYKEEDFDNFRTIHSFCKKHLDNVQVVDPRVDMLEFHTDWGTVSANMTDEDMNNKIFNNWFLRVYDKSRNLLIEPDEAFRREVNKRGRLIQYRDIIRNYEEFKKNHKIDFTDMIEKYIEEVNSQHYKVFIVDEAQDLTPLQWKFVYKISEKARRVYLAGDDDQAIYEWNGADVHCFLGFPGKVFILKKSYRLNRDIHSLSKEILKFIPIRQEKEFTSNEVDGYIERYSKFNEIPINKIGGSWLILGRVRNNVNELQEFARAKGLYFQDMRGNKSFNMNKWLAISYWEKLKNGGTLNKEEVGIMYDFIHEVRRGWRKIDAKSWSAIHPNEPLNLKFLKQQAGLETPNTDWWNVLNRKFTTKDLDYFETMLKNNVELDDKANIIIDTIHSVKGGEADNVIIYEKSNWPSHFNSKTGNDKMAEARVWYTGVTRAKKTLHLLATDHQFHFPMGKIFSNYKRSLNDK